MLRLALVLILMGALPLAAAAQSSTGAPPREETAPETTAPRKAALRAGAEAPLYYAVDRQVQVFADAALTRPYLTLGFREPVRLVRQQKGRLRVRTEGGAEGYVRASSVSNVWIRVSKKQRAVYLYRGTRLMKTVKADFGYNNFSDKERRGSTTLRDHWRTPEGTFYVVAKNPASQFTKALVLNYPTASDAKRGLRQGLISEAEHRAIVSAQAEHAVPPMNTALGGWIEIHGDGTGRGQDWTQGCVAIHNDDMRLLWRWAQVGTPVVVE